MLLNVVAQAQTPELSILLTDGFGGRFQSDGHYLGLDAFEEAIRQQREDIGTDKIVTASLGNSVAPFYLSRMDNGQAMIKALSSIGYDAMVPGNYEFEYGTDFFTSTDTGQLSFVCANLLKPDGTPFLSPYRVVERNGLKVAIVGIMDTEMRKYILDENFAISTGELKLVDPLAVLRNLIPRVREVADFVILISNFPFERNNWLMNRVSAINAVVSRQGEQVQTRYVEVVKPRPTGGTFEQAYVLVPQHKYLVRFDFTQNESGNFLVTEFSRMPVKTPAEPSTTLAEIIGTLEDRFASYCQARFRRKPDATLIKLSPETMPEDFARYVLYVMMARSRSELGLIHHRHFDFSYWEAVKADGKLTIRECFLLMRENHGLQTLRLTGKILKQLASQNQAEKDAGNDYLHFLSVKPEITLEGVQWLVHGLPLRDAEIYASCATHVLTNGVTAFDAMTKGTHIKTKFKMTKYLRFIPDGETKVVRDVVIDYLLEIPARRNLSIGEQLTAEPYLQRVMWRLGIEDSSVFFNVTRAQNTEIYPGVTIPKLQKPEIINLRLDGQIRVTRETPSLLWENVFRTTLGAVKTGQDPFTEDKDDLRFDTRFVFGVLNFAGLRPTVGLGFDTEYVTKEDILRQLDFLINAGVSLPDVWRFSRSRLEYRRITDLNAGDTRRQGLNALGLTTQLVVPMGRLRWTNTVQGIYYLPDNSPNSERRQLLIDARSGLNILLIENLSFGPSFEALLFKGQGESTVAAEYLLSFRLSYFKDWKWQYLRYFLGTEKE